MPDTYEGIIMKHRFFLLILAAFMALNLRAQCTDSIPAPVYMANIQFDTKTNILSFNDVFHPEKIINRSYGISIWYKTQDACIRKTTSQYIYGDNAIQVIVQAATTAKVSYGGAQEFCLHNINGKNNLISECYKNGYSDIRIFIQGRYENDLNPGDWLQYEGNSYYNLGFNNYVDVTLPTGIKRMSYIYEVNENDNAQVMLFGSSQALTAEVQSVEGYTYKWEFSKNKSSWNSVKQGNITTVDARKGVELEYTPSFAIGTSGDLYYRLIISGQHMNDTSVVFHGQPYYTYSWNNGNSSYNYKAGEKITRTKPADCLVYVFDSELQVSQRDKGNGYVEITMPACPVEEKVETPTYTVKFWNSDLTLLKAEEVVCGGDATAPAEPTMQNLIFDHWSADFTNVHRNLNIYARYTMAGNYSFDAAQIAHTNKLYPADGFADSETRAMMGDSITFWASLATPSASRLYFQTARRNAQGEWDWNGSTLVGEFTDADVAAGKAKEFTKTVPVFYNYYNEQYLEQGFAFRFMVNCGGESIYSEVYEYDVYYPLYINSLIDEGGMYETLMVENTAHDIALGAENILIPARYQDTIRIYRLNGGAGACMNFARVNKPQSMYALEDGLDEEGNAYVIAPGEKETLNVDVAKVAVVFDGAAPVTKYDFTSQGVGYKGNAYYAEVVNCGGAIQNIPADPANGQQTLFVGWEAWGDYDNDAYLNVPATGDSYIGFTAKWEDIPDAPTYTVIFFDKDGNILSTQEVKEGENAVPPVAPEVAGYHFVGWDSPYTTITNDKDITAVYGEDSKTWTVTYLNWDNSPLGTEQVNDGEAAQGVIATRTGYTFVGWSEDISSVKSDMTVTALFDVSVFTITYTIDGVKIMSEQVAYGAMPAAYQSVEDQGKPATEQYVYTFSHWTPAIVPAVADATYEAVFTPSPRKYLVVFQNWDHSFLAEQQVEYGKAATAPADPTREGYTFKGWDRAFNNIITDMTVTALFEKNKTQGIDETVNRQSSNRKFLRDGQLFILRDGKTFNALGVEVR